VANPHCSRKAPGISLHSKNLSNLKCGRSESLNLTSFSSVLSLAYFSLSGEKDGTVPRFKTKLYS
jgi:hypothetical protein